MKEIVFQFKSKNSDRVANFFFKAFLRRLTLGEFPLPIILQYVLFQHKSLRETDEKLIFRKIFHQKSFCILVRSLLPEDVGAVNYNGIYTVCLQFLGARCVFVKRKFW